MTAAAEDATPVGDVGFLCFADVLLFSDLLFSLEHMSCAFIF